MVVHLEDLELLKKQHTEWDTLLNEEEARPRPNPDLIQTYKKHKLKIKDNIRETEKELFKGP